MSFAQLTPENWQTAVTRILINGPPNSLKTTSLHTFPKPVHIVSFPGEKGFSSIKPSEDVKAYTWKTDDVTKDSPAATVAAVETLTWEILGGKYGPVTTFAGDGLHKLYEAYFEQEYAKLQLVHNGAHQNCKFCANADELVGPAYGNAHSEFSWYVNKVLSSTVPYAVFTCWDGLEKDDPENKRSATHIFPDLPGKMARRIVGEFAVVLYAKVGLPMPDGNRPASWQVHPAGKIWGAGVKVPPDVAKRLPPEVPQDWAKLEKLLFDNAFTQAAAPAPAPPKPPTVPK